jgi:AcrR family transcriptional regulator
MMTLLMDKDLHLDHENARLILEQGWLLFQQKGFRGVNIDELCRHCGLTKPTLYYYFKDKETLFVQVLEYKLHGFHAVIEQPGELSERLQRIAATILASFQTEYSVLLRDREHLKKAENLARLKDAFHSELFGPLIALMQEGLDQSLLQGESAELLALIFLGMLNNFIGRDSEIGLDDKSLAGALTGYFLHGVCKR